MKTGIVGTGSWTRSMLKKGFWKHGPQGIVDGAWEEKGVVGGYVLVEPTRRCALGHLWETLVTEDYVSLQVLLAESQLLSWVLFRALGSEIFNLDPVGTTSRGWATARQVSNCFLGLTPFPESTTRRLRLFSRGTDSTLQRLKADLCFLIVLSPVPPAVDPPLNFSFCRQEQYSLWTVFLTPDWVQSLNLLG